MKILLLAPVLVGSIIALHIHLHPKLMEESEIEFHAAGEQVPQSVIKTHGPIRCFFTEDTLIAWEPHWNDWRASAHPVGTVVCLHPIGDSDHIGMYSAVSSANLGFVAERWEERI